MENTKKTGYLPGLSKWVGKHPYLLIIGVSILLMAPALILGLPWEADDGMSHRRWQLFFAKQFWSGNLFPRWLVDLNNGFGSPAFFIYPPLSHFAAALFYPIFPESSGVPYRLSFSVLFSIIISGIGAYHWIYQFTRERYAAIAGAIVYVSAPYHLVIDVYIRGAIAEIWAFTWAPWTLLAIHMFGSRGRRAVLLYVISAAALLFSHAPSSLFLFFTYIVYAALLARIQKDAGILIYTITCTAIAILISGIYVATALTHTNYVNTEALYGGYFKFFNWLMFSDVRWPSTKAEYSITGTAVVQVLAAISFGLTSLLIANAKPASRVMVWFAFLGTLLTFLLMSTWSASFWKVIFPLQKIQFPWRLLMLQSLFLAMLAGSCIQATSGIKLPSRRNKVYLLVLSVIAGFFVINVTFYALTIKPRPGPEIEISETPEYTLGDTKRSGELFQPNQKAAILRGQGEANVLRWSPRHLVIDVNAQSPVQLVMKQFFYPGWQYRTDDSMEYKPVQKLDEGRPILSVNLNAGHSRLEVVLKPTFAEKIGIAASLFGCIALVAFLFFLVRHTSVAPVRERVRGFSPDYD